MKKIPVQRPSRAQVEHMRREMYFVYKSRILSLLQIGGYQHVKPHVHSEMEDKILEKFKDLSPEGITKALKEAEENLSRLQRMM